MTHGSCLCGKIRFSLRKGDDDNLFSSIAHCHCKMCRKFHGAAFSTFGEVKESNFELIGDSMEHLKAYKSEENDTIRKFCGNCGTKM